MFCKKCGAEVKDTAKFCPRCGTAFSKAIETKKMHRVVALATSLVLLLGACSGVFVFRDEIMSLISGQKQFDENHVGEIYYQEIDEEHVATDDSGIMYADNEILVVAKENTKKSQIEKLAKKYDADIVGWIEQTGDYQWEMNSIYSIDELESIVSELKNENIIDSASINYISEISESGLPVNYGKEWSGETWDENDHAGSNWGLEAIHALSAWEVLEEHKEKINPIRLGLIDGGFDTDHEDLEDCFVDTFYNTSPNDHGTHVAGIMAANVDNVDGICGVYPYGKDNLYGVAYGVTDYSENGDYFTSTIVQKISFVELILRNVKVINQSECFNQYNNKFGTYDNLGNLISIDYQGLANYWNTNSFNSEKEYTRVFADFLNRLIEKGYDFVIVSAAGNDSDESIGHLESKYSSWNNMIDRNEYPAVFDRIIVVGAIGEERNNGKNLADILYDGTLNIKKGDSGYHISNFSNLGNRVDVLAPGENIFSTVINGYDKMDGTSMAAPHVAGVAAMVWAANNNLTGAEVKEIICSTANNLISQPGSSYYKTDYKLVDAKSAVEKALGIEKEETTEPQNGGILCWVVNKDNEDEKIEGATVTATNVDTGVPESTKTDSEGHFELFLPEGNYTLTVTAKEYDDYTYNGTIEVKNNGVNYLDDWIKMKRSKGSISGTVVDELGNPIKNAHIIANQTINNTLADKKATTDSNGYFKVECNPGNYRIKVTADGYEEYNSDEVINVEKDFDTILDTIQLKKIKKEYTESDLKEKVLAESGGNILSWFYEDYDGNGTKEAYSLVDIGTGGSEGDLIVYFIDADGNTKIMNDSPWDLNYFDTMAKCTEYEGKNFFSVDLSGGGSGYSTFLASVKDGNAYELDISNSLQGFFVKNGICYTTENDFSSGIHTYPEVELIYNSSTQQFSKGNRIISEENNTISDWKSAYIEVLSNLNNSSARFTTAYIDEDDIPELIVAYDSSHVAGCEIYTYYDGKVSKLEGNPTNGEFGSSGEILYLPYKNLFDSRYYGTGSNSDSLYRINNGNAQSECNLQYNDYFTTVRVIEFKIDGIEKNENEYWDKYNSYGIDSMSSLNYDDMIETNSNNISNYFN